MLKLWAIDVLTSIIARQTARILRGVDRFLRGKLVTEFHCARQDTRVALWTG